ncbi:hypothetical protein HYH03_006378 [Edaphochlamys debaryana]|uniref:Thioredoxin domain-containing protein n=1 Tax=Edaphochlamys debaryana TaxID=47281 RepID=A0A836C045_9CHLO|nr:hypothetical protein HYH03_006378 [Edaphochlamys debaryana]|eukprot:KAG2495431.1 hypothetical protein HYH03_006378 [Edaphochlamys debaryana]
MALLATSGRVPVAGARRSPAAGACPRRMLSSAPARLRLVPAQAQKQQFSTFEDMLAGSEVPLLVDFYATWCGPCQMMTPTLSAIQARYKGRLQVVKIDTDKYPGIASTYRVQALPTICLFKDGKPVFRFEGVLNEPQLAERLEYYLAGQK